MKYLFLITLLTVYLQSNAQNNNRNNFQHLPGTETQPIGQFGDIVEVGEGPVPVIFIGSYSLGMEVYSDFMERNGDDYTFYGITLAGISNTAPPPMPITEDMSYSVWLDGIDRGIIKLIKEKELNKPFLMAHFAQSGYNALNVARLAPELVGGVILLSAQGRLSLKVFPFDPENPGGLSDDERREPTPVERWNFVNTYRAGFFRGITKERWNQGTYKADYYSRNNDRGAMIFEHATSHPLPVILRYYLEWMSTDIAPLMNDIEVPILSVINILDEEYFKVRFNNDDITYNEYVNRIKNKDLNEEGIQWYRENDMGWLWLKKEKEMPNLTVKIVENAREFFMYDAPQQTDQIIFDFIDSIK